MPERKPVILIGKQIGAPSCKIQFVHVGRNCLVGAEALVLKDVPKGATVFGVLAPPASRKP